MLTSLASDELLASRASKRERLSTDQLSNPRVSHPGTRYGSQSRGVTPYVEPSTLHSTYGPPIPSWSHMAPFDVLIKQEPHERDMSGIHLSVRHTLPPYFNKLQDTEDYMGDCEEMEDVESTDASKLKGVFWPGMDMFDSATPDARRKRNQKKSTNVLERLEAMSQEIQPTEVVYNRAGNVRKIRIIDGVADPGSSPLSGEEPPPKPLRKTARRKALGELDANVQRRPRKSVKQATQAGHNASGIGLDLGQGKKKRKAKEVKVHTDDANRPASFGQAKNLERLLESYDPKDRENIPPNPYRDQPQVDPFACSEDLSSAHHNYGGVLTGSHDGTILAPFSMDGQYSAAWDFLGRDLDEPLTNPLYMSGCHSQDDDERTISAAPSDK